MSRGLLASSGRPYGRVRVCRTLKIPHSMVYSQRKRDPQDPEASPKKRGPKGAYSDERLVEENRNVLEESTWNGDGYRKVWAKLRYKGIGVSQRKVVRQKREYLFPAKDRPVPTSKSKDHKVTIIPERPNQIWGTEAITIMTGEGNATIFLLLVPSSADCLGILPARRGTPFESLVLFRHALRTIFRDFKEGIEKKEDLLLRNDRGSKFVSHAYQTEIRFVGVTSSPAYVRGPETIGCAERFVRTLKKQLLWLCKFDTIEESNQAPQRLMHNYNNSWNIQRHGYLTPAQAQKQAFEKVVVAE